MEQQTNSQRFASEHEYLLALEVALKYFPRKQRKDIIKSYQIKLNNSVDHSANLTKTLDGLPSPEDVAQGMYDRKGKIYISKQQKKYNRNKQVVALSNCLAIFILSAILVSIVTFFGHLTINKVILWVNIWPSGIVNIVVMGLIILAYIGITLTLGIFLLDVYIIAIRFLLKQIFLVWLKKWYKYVDTDFLLTDWLNTISKEKRFITKVLSVCVAVMLTMFVIGYFMKTYIYYSLRQEVNTLYTYEYQFDEEQIKTINIEGYEGKIIISKGTNFAIKYRNQFNLELDLKEEETELILYYRSSRTYDFFGLINEPPQVIEICLPQNVSPVININVERPMVEVVTNFTGELNINDGFITDLKAKEVHIENIYIKTTRIDLKLEKGTFGNVYIESQKGTILSSDNTFDSIKIDNYAAGLGFANTSTAEMSIINVNGDIVMSGCTITMFALETTSSTVILEQYTFEKATVKAHQTTKFKFINGSAEAFDLEINGSDLEIYNFSGALTLACDNTNMLLNKLKGSVNVKNTNSNTVIFDAYLSFFTAELKDINQVQIYHIGTTSFFEVTMTNCLASIDQVYAPTVEITEQGGQVFYSNDEGARDQLISHSDPFYHDIYKDETKIRDFTYQGNVISRNVNEE